MAELWLVDTEAPSVLVHGRSSPGAPAFDDHVELAAGEELTSPLLPGFGVAVESIFDL